ncbi:MAG TPA: hypothetical protein VKC56_05590 [Gallionellaceae bacterium]|nr:hypothetical protein [Gallionellaceae bacterium]
MTEARSSGVDHPPLAASAAMIDAAVAEAPRKKPSRRLAVYASLWVLSAMLENGSYGTALLETIFASLTLGAILLAMARETRKLRPRGMTFAAGLYLACWGFVMVGTGLRLLWLNAVALIYAH